MFKFETQSHLTSAATGNPEQAHHELNQGGGCQTEPGSQRRILPSGAGVPKTEAISRSRHGGGKMPASQKLKG
jgi:hypothetical protein